MSDRFLDTAGDIWSGPAALLGLRDLSILFTSSEVLINGGMSGVVLSPLEGSFPLLSLLNTEQYCLFRMFALPTASDIKTPFSRRGETVQGSFLL